MLDVNVTLVDFLVVQCCLSVVVLFLADPFSVWNSTTSFRMNNVAKRRIRLDDGDKSKTIICSVLFCFTLLPREKNIRIIRMAFAVLKDDEKLKVIPLFCIAHPYCA